MRLRKKLMVAGQEYGLVNENVALYYNRPGRAVFQVRATDDQAEALTGMVQFALGWAHSNGMTLFFTGDIERAVRVDGQQRRLFCREISARLDSNIPLAIRHATLKDVLGAYAAATGLEFILPDNKKAVCKVLLNSEYGLDNLTVTSAASSTTSGKTKLTISPALTSGNSYKYKVADNAVLPAAGQPLHRRLRV